MKKNTAKKFLVKRTLTINADEILTLHLLAQLNDNILTSGLKKDVTYSYVEKGVLQCVI